MNFIHRYLNYYKEAKQTFVELKISQFTFHHIIFRYLSFYLTPLFLFLNISDNQATLVRTIVGILSLFLILIGEISYGIYIFFLGDIIDCVDGNISRINNTATYFGKFIDGYSDAVIENLLIFSLTVFYILNFEMNVIEISFFIITITINLSFHFILERYNNFLRWAKELNVVDDKPIFKKKNLIIINVFNDLRYLFLILITINNSNKLFIYSFLSISILYSIYKIYLVMRKSLILEIHRKSVRERKKL
jgi:phosphatidylglycerophosphate synthase